jgi:hypothetical protein
MPCCAFAAFIISQIVLGFGAIKRLVLRRDDALDEAPRNPATEWRLIGAAPVLESSPGRHFGIRTFAFAASIEILLAVGAVYGYYQHAHHHHHHDAASVPVSVRIR